MKNYIKLGIFFILVFLLTLSSVYAATIKWSLKNQLWNYVNYICYSTPMTWWYYTCIMKNLDHENSYGSVSSLVSNSSNNVSNLEGNNSLLSNVNKISSERWLMTWHWWYDNNTLVADIPFYSWQDWLSCISPYNRNSHSFRDCRMNQNPSFVFPKWKTLSLRVLSKNDIKDDWYTLVRLFWQAWWHVKWVFSYSISKVPWDFSSWALLVSTGINDFINIKKSVLNIEWNTIYYINIKDNENSQLWYHSNPQLQISNFSWWIFYIPSDLPEVYWKWFFDEDTKKYKQDWVEDTDIYQQTQLNLNWIYNWEKDTWKWLWIPKSNPNLYVVDPISIWEWINLSAIPPCFMNWISSSSSWDCANKYNSTWIFTDQNWTKISIQLKKGNIISMRYNTLWENILNNYKSIWYFQFLWFDWSNFFRDITISFSENPWDFNVNNKCILSSDKTKSASWPIFSYWTINMEQNWVSSVNGRKIGTLEYCDIKPNTNYYLNMKIWNEEWWYFQLSNSSRTIMHWGHVLNNLNTNQTNINNQTTNNSGIIQTYWSCSAWWIRYYKSNNCSENSVRFNCSNWQLTIWTQFSPAPANPIIWESLYNTVQDCNSWTNSILNNWNLTSTIWLNSSNLSISVTRWVINLTNKNTVSTVISGIKQENTKVCAEVVQNPINPNTVNTWYCNNTNNYLSRNPTSEWKYNWNWWNVDYAPSFYLNSNIWSTSWLKVTIYVMDKNTWEKVSWTVNVIWELVANNWLYTYWGSCDFTWTKYFYYTQNSCNSSKSITCNWWILETWWTWFSWQVQPYFWERLYLTENECKSKLQLNSNTCNWESIWTAFSPVVYPTSNSCNSANNWEIKWVDVNDFKCTCRN